MPSPTPNQQEMWLAMENMQAYIEELETRLDAADQDNANQVNMYAQRITQLESDKLAMSRRLAVVEKFMENPLKLVDILLDRSLTMGSGAQSMHFNVNEGCWWGQNTLAEIVGGAKGVAILFDGTFYQNP